MLVIKKVKKKWLLYPIGSPKGALNSKRKPEYVGTIKFKENKGKLTINRFIANYDYDEKLIPPGQIIKLLKSQAVFLATKSPKLEEFLKSLGIKIRYTKICDFCAYEGIITIVNSSYSYSYNNQIICKNCAHDTIKEELKLNNFDKKVFRNFKDLLDKTNDLEKVLSILNPKFDPFKHNDLTLFDNVSTNTPYKIPKTLMKRLKIPHDFRDILIKNGNEYLLPVQYLAIKEGLLKNKDLLVVSATGSGKTLVGELAGIVKALNGKKFIFLTPLVALANQKYRDFKKKYSSLGLKVGIKVGQNRVKAKGELRFSDSDLSTADIIVGTYEGIDYLIRLGNFNVLGDLGLILIDEIHMVDDEDRGVRLNGLIKRIRYLYPKAQFIGLSATIKNANFLAKEFSMKLVNYPYRNVALERHLCYFRNNSDKRRFIKKIVKSEYNIKSKKGFRGQTIIFTNSRRNTHKLTNFLLENKIQAAAYHAGLSYYKKEKIEKDFDKGKISTVVTTAALAAGVDFPASQVIFDSLLMGNKWISPNEFSQMLGRAGRPTYHDRGVVYLLPEIGNEFDGESEESMALQLLESSTEEVFIEYDEESSYEMVLADISSKTIKSCEELEKYYHNIEIPIDLKTCIRELEDLNLIDLTFNITSYGKAVSMSFLSISKAEYIRKNLNNSTYLTKYLKKSQYYKKKENINKLKVKIIAIAMDLQLFENAYLSSVIHNQIANALKIKFSTRLFAESTLDIISSGEAIDKVDSKFQEALIAIQTDFLRCTCEDRPFCKCLQRSVTEFIIHERLKGRDPQDISSKLFRMYQIQVYPGDIFSFLDNYLKNIDAIKRIASAFNNKKVVKMASKLSKSIEEGKS